MARACAIEAKIGWRFREAAAKMVVPEPIDQNAREKRVVSSRDPGGQSATTIGIGRVGW